MATNKYSIGSEVYLRESAVRGFIESYIVNSMSQGADGFWRYIIGTVQRPPIINTTGGDRNTLKAKLVSKQYQFLEDELVTYCEALDIAIPVVLAQYNRLVALKAATCESGTGSGGV